MYPKVMKLVSITALLLAVVFWNYAGTYQLELNLVVSVAAAVVLIQALQARKYRWVAAFLVIGLLFNPVVRVFRLEGAIGLSLVVLSVAPFVISLVALREDRLMSIPSITDRNPGSQSL